MRCRSSLHCTNMLFMILFASFVLLRLSTSDNVNKRLLLDGGQDGLAELHRLSALVDQIMKEKNETDKKLRQLEASVSQLQQSKVGAGSDQSTFVRWGRTTCPGNGTSLIYSGFVGGSHYSNKGGAANHVCLSKDPLWGHYDDGVGADARIYGTEYQFSGEPSYASGYFGKNLRDDDAPCAVCATNRSINVMIPGRNRCTPGWTEEYHGYLVSGLDGYAVSEYICLDERPEVIPGGRNDSNGGLFCMVEGICGSLACPPYVNGREITCVVCSK